MKGIALTLAMTWLILPISGWSQINDCADAAIVCSSANLEFNPSGPGYNDFADPDNIPGCITSLEQNSAWYYFQIDPNAPPGLELGFIIHPNGGLGEDYDWALFGPNVDCSDLGAPLRCSSSSAACGFCPETGLGMGTTDFTEGPGTGDGFVMTIIVEPGQGYYLMIDNWLGTMDGFVLTWTEEAAPYLNCDAKPPCALGATAGNDLNVCEGEEFVLSGSSTNANGGEIYTWSGTNGGTAFLSDPNIAAPTVTLPEGFSGLITYTLTVEEDTCHATDEMNVLVNALPSIQINPAGPFCQNNPPVVLSATPGGGVWGGDNTGNTFNPMTNGPGIHTVSYTYTNAIGCTNTEYLDIEVFEIPTSVIDPDPAQFCDSEGSVLLTATGDGGAGNYLFHWSTPAGNGDGNTFDADVSGNYLVTVTDENGCTGTASTTVTSYANPYVEIVEPDPICITLDLFTIEAIPPGGEFFGENIDPQGELYPNMIDPGTYSISYTYTDENNCSSTAFNNYTIIESPEALASNSGPVCEGQTLLLMGETNATGSDIIYQWEGPGNYFSNEQNPSDATLPGTYVLQIFVDNCPSDLVATNVVFIETPEAYASNSGPYCIGETIQLTGSTNLSEPNIIYSWTGPNGYTSDLQNPSDAIEAGIYTLVVTIGTCTSLPSQTEVIFSLPPDAAASNDGPYCAGQSIALFGSTQTGGSITTYSWTGPNGFLSSDQNPTGANESGIYQLIIDVDGCQSLPVTTLVIINSNPQPSISGQEDFCTGFSSTLDAGPGYATYEWNDLTSTQWLEVFDAGIYSVTVSDGNGCTGSSSFMVTENASLSPVITGQLEFCEGGNTILDAGTGYSAYQWSNGETSQTIEITNGGSYGVIVTDSDGCSGSVSVTAIEHPTPAVTIGGSSTYCIGGFTVLDAGNGYASYLWNDNSTSQSLTVTSPGTYSVDIIDIHGCGGSASVTVNESTSLSPVITGLPAFCESGSTLLNAGQFSTYLWSDGSAVQYLEVFTAGTYDVTVSDGQGCTGSSSVSVTEVSPPSSVVTPSVSLCNTIAGGSVINLFDLIVSGDSGGNWVDADLSGAVGLFDNLNFNNVPAGDYTFIYTTNSAIPPCPEASYEVTVTVLDCTCPEVFFASGGPLCNKGDVLDLSTLEMSNEPGVWSVFQVPAGSNPASLNGTVLNVSDSDPGNYLLQFSLVNQPPPGCPVDFEVIVQVDASVNAGQGLAPASYCEKDQVLIDLSQMITGEDANGMWTEISQTPSTGNAFNPLSGMFDIRNQIPGTYSFTYELLSGGVCPDDTSIAVINIYPLPLVLIEPVDAIDCENPVQIIHAENSTSGPEFIYEWTGPGLVLDGNETTLQPTIDQPGQYNLTITHIHTGCSSAGSILVSAQTDPPTGALIFSQDPSCSGEDDGSISFDGVMGGTPPYEYSINGNLHSSNDFINLSAGDYIVGIKDNNGCRWDTMITLAEPSPLQIDLGPDIEIGLGEHGTIQVIVNVPVNEIDTMIWTPAGIVECLDIYCQEAIINAFNSTTLQVTLIDQYGCQVTDAVFIYVDKTRRIYFPSVFSPNDDGINDVFFISADEGQVEKIHTFRIFSRWGEAIFEQNEFDPNDPSKRWEGLFRDKVVNPGVYVYYAEVEYIDGVEEKVYGDITVIR